MIRDSSAMDRSVDRPRRRRWPLLLLLAASIAGAIYAYPSVKRWASSETSVSLAEIRIGTVERGDLVHDVSVQGNVVAAFRPTLVSPVRGIVRVVAEAGKLAEAGEVLARLSNPEIESRLQQERSTLESLRSEVERQRILAKQGSLQGEQDIRLLEVEVEAARRALERAERSRAEGLLNVVELEKAQDEVEVSTLELELARQRLALDREMLDFEVREKEAEVVRQGLVVADLERQVDELTVRAPVSSLVSRVEVTDRESVTVGQALVALVDLSAFEIEVSVPESYTQQLGPGTEAVISVGGRDFRGVLESLSAEVRGSRVQGVVAFSGEAPEGLKQNQRVTTRLLLDTRSDTLKVPRGAFLESGGGRLAYVVEDGLAVLRDIEVGARSVAEVEILSGLDVGDRIVLSDTNRFEGAEKILLRR
ncbi:MAG: HlyD family efflux transporter periplasmic adaptor subunit [Acidobacteriota bacterium]